MPQTKPHPVNMHSSTSFPMVNGKRKRSGSPHSDGLAPKNTPDLKNLCIEDKPTELFNKVPSTSGSVTSSARHLSNCTVTTLNKEEEEDLIRELRAQSRNQLKVDPLKELDEALMDRTTA
jgi:hypothetical protein